MIIIFVQKFLSVNSNLGQERHGYTCAEVSVTHFFYAKSFIQNYRGVPELFKKPPGVHPPPPLPPPHPKKKFAKV